MDYEKIGKVIYELRTERRLTQKELADELNISDKTVSKWERVAGCPDISLLRELAKYFCVDMEKVLGGSLAENDFVGGNMKKSKFYVCPICGNVTVCTGNAEISCCGRKLEAIEPRKINGEDVTEEEKKAASICVETVEDDWYITSAHPMRKDDYISFVAFLTGDQLHMYKAYPEWDLQIRIPKRGHGMLVWYSTQQGLFYQLI